MYNACDITPKKTSDLSGLYFGLTRSKLASSSSEGGSNSSNNQSGDADLNVGAQHYNNVKNSKLLDASSFCTRFPLNSHPDSSRLNSSSPLRLLKSSSSESHSTPSDRSKMDFSALDSMRLGFSWLQNNQSNAGDVARSTPRKSQSGGRGVISMAVMNPFDNDLVETMQMSSCSPSVFSKVLTPSKIEDESGGFNWGVENAALLYPTEFDNIHNQTASMVDQETEDKLQSAINTYFAQKVVVPSPWIENDDPRSPANSDRWTKTEKKTVSSQTILSIPPQVDLSKVLAGFMTFNETPSPSVDERDLHVMSFNNPRRKLFVDGELDASMAASYEEPPSSVAVEEEINGEKENKRTAPFSPHTFGCDDVVDLRGSDRYQRATSISPPKHIKTPTDSPIKLFEADVSMENKQDDSSSAQHSSSDLLNEDADISYECYNTSLVVSKDTGYQTEKGKLSSNASPRLYDFTDSLVQNNGEVISTGSQENFLQAPSYGLDPRSMTSESSWSPQIFSTPSKESPL